MNRENFFQRIIDDYLFLDLKNMSELTQKEGEGGGAASYPMLAACVSGMELLGGLLYKKDYSHTRDWNYFEYYWNEYLIKINPAYEPYGKMFWDLVRNGVAHTYIAKAAITVTKENPANHLVFHGKNKFNIDCTEFYKDFLKSYESLVKPKLKAEDSFTAQIDKNIGILLQESDDFSKEVFSKIKNPGTPIATKTTEIFSPTPSGIGLSTTMTTTMIPDNIRQKFGQTLHPNRAFISGASLMTQESAESLKKSLEEDQLFNP